MKCCELGSASRTEPCKVGSTTLYSPSSLAKCLFANRGEEISVSAALPPPPRSGSCSGVGRSESKKTFHSKLPPGSGRKEEGAWALLWGKLTVCLCIGWHVPISLCLYPSRKHQDSKKEEEKKKPHIKKPLNAFMLYMKEMRAKVVAECTLKESAAINQILGRRVGVPRREDHTRGL